MIYQKIRTRIKHWLAERRRKKKSDEAVELCRQIYQNVPSFELAIKARSEQGLFSYEYIYGEIDYYTFAQLLSLCKIKPKSIFYDLGSGAGKAVILSALLYDLERACGIEQLQLLHECAQNATKQLGYQNIQFYQADLLTVNWFDADILFVNASAFIGDFWEKLLARLHELQRGTRIILISKALPAEAFTLLYDDFLPMSWGMARTRIYSVGNPTP